MLFDFIFGKILNPNIIILEFMIGSYKKKFQLRNEENKWHIIQRGATPGHQEQSALKPVQRSGSKKKTLLL